MTAGLKGLSQQLMHKYILLPMRSIKLKALKQGV